MIKPTVGRVVWFWMKKPAENENVQPLAAIVAWVWSDTCVNLAIFTQSGVPMGTPPTSVRLVQEGEELPEGSMYCTWMPFQLGQAKAVRDALNATDK